MHPQHRRILVALLDGPMTTLDAISRAGTTCLSQRAGEMERMGLVWRGRHNIDRIEGKGCTVCLAYLTPEGRRVAQALRDGTYTEGGGGNTEPGASPATLPATAEAGGNLKSSTPAPSLFKEIPPRHDWRK
jgi:hypothetical protein